MSSSSIERIKQEMAELSKIWNKERPWLTHGLQFWQRANMIGEVLYPKIKELCDAEKENLPKFITAGKITGMLVELPIKEADLLVGDDEALKAKYEETKAVLVKFHTEGLTASK